MSQSRARLAFVAGAAVLLTAVIVAVAVSGSSNDEGAADECVTAWNDDAIARSDGAHAYQAHGYRATLLARIDEDGNVVAEADAEGEPTPQERCAVIFASPQVDVEPDFGVRVLDDGQWTGLAAADGVALTQIEALQQDATATANATLLPDGRLAD